MHAVQSMFSSFGGCIGVNAFGIDDFVGGATSVVAGGSSWNGVGACAILRGFVISMFTAVG